MGVLRGLSYLVGVDGFSIWLVVLTAFMTPLAILSSWRVSTGSGCSWR